MKKKLMTMVIALCVAVAVQAQDAPRRHGGQGRNMDPAKMVEMQVNRMNEELSLTADQKAAITEILTKDFQARQAEMKQKQGDTAKPSREQMDANREQMKARQDAVNAQVEQLLTAEQKAKFAKMKDRGPRGGRHGMKKGKMKDSNGGKECGGSCCEQKKEK